MSVFRRTFLWLSAVAELGLPHKSVWPTHHSVKYVKFSEHNFSPRTLAQITVTLVRQRSGRSVTVTVFVIPKEMMPHWCNCASIYGEILQVVPRPVHTQSYLLPYLGGWAFTVENSGLYKIVKGHLLRASARAVNNINWASQGPNPSCWLLVTQVECFPPVF